MAGEQAANLMLQLAREVASAKAELGLEVVANVTEATPVDTGHAAASWFGSVGDPVLEDAEDVASALARKADGTAALLAYQEGHGDVFVANPAPYIEFINGDGFIETAADQALATVQARHDAKKTQL